MLAIIEIASSGLGPDSFPIAVAWRELRGTREDHLLIRPAPGWRDWQYEAESVHHISRRMLERDGRPVEHVTSLLSRELGQATVFSDSINLDQTWLDRLFATAPGTRSISLRRYSELFPGADQAEIARAITGCADPMTSWVTLADVRRRAIVAERYLQSVGSSKDAKRPRARTS